VQPLQGQTALQVEALDLQRDHLGQERPLRQEPMIEVMPGGIAIHAATTTSWSSPIA
jgi:hypothetical protein